MNKNIGKGLAVAIIAAMLFSLSGAYAYEGGDTPKNEARRDAHFKKMTEELKLTSEQQEQLTKDREEFFSKSKDVREKMKAVRTDLKAELDKPSIDKARVDSLVAEMKNLVGTQIQIRVDKVIAMKKVLTPEQYQKMKESKKDWKNGKSGKGDKRHGKGDANCPM